MKKTAEAARLEGRYALISGGAAGIGLACGGRCLAEGASIALMDLPTADWSTAEDMSSEFPGRVILLDGDVTRASDWNQAVSRCRSDLGGLDILVNNAGISGPLGSFFDVSEDQFQQVMDVNVKGVLLGMQHAGQVMRDQGAGSIINISSVSGLGGGRSVIAYAASKYAVVGMTKIASTELSPLGVRVNAVCPAPTDTQMVRQLEEAMFNGNSDRAQQFIDSVIPMGRYGDPDEIAAVVAFLASDQASFMSGVAVPVDGGLGAR